MNQLTQIALAGSVIAFTSCQANWGNPEKDFVQYRLGIEPQYRHIKEVKANFKTPNLVSENKRGLGIYGGPSISLYSSERTRVLLGLDARLNMDWLHNPNTSGKTENFGGCLEGGELSRVEQGFFTGIPYVQLQQEMGELLFKVEVGMPFTHWNVETGSRAFGSCFVPAQKESLYDFGQKVRLGIISNDSRHGFDSTQGQGLYLTYERYRNSLVDVDMYGIELSLGF